MAAVLAAACELLPSTAVCGNVDFSEHGLYRDARSGPLLCASPACDAIERRGPSRTSSARPDLPASSCLGLSGGHQVETWSLGDSVRGVVLALSIRQSSLRVSLVPGGQSAPSALIGWSAWLVELCSCMCCSAVATRRRVRDNLQP